MSPTFGEILRAYRTAAEMRQLDLANAIGRSAAWVTPIESGTAPPPDEATCHALAQALHLPDPEALWAAAAPERLQRLHPDLYAFFMRGAPPSRALADHTHTELLAELARRLHVHPSC